MTRQHKSRGEERKRAGSINCEFQCEEWVGRVLLLLATVLFVTRNAFG